MCGIAIGRWLHKTVSAAHMAWSFSGLLGFKQLDICVATGNCRKPPPELGIKALKTNKVSKTVAGVGKDVLSVAATPLSLLTRNKGDPDKTKSYQCVTPLAVPFVFVDACIPQRHLPSTTLMLQRITPVLFPYAAENHT
eukprot:5738338-Pyramimonas_sp.AAC.1